ncbi:MAG: TSUP family transporter, partial [Burkholderiales bacterium]
MSEGLLSLFNVYSPGLLAALLLLGAAVGFAAGLLGIGGGMLLVPFLTYLFTYLAFPTEHIVHMAIATSLSTILFTSLSSVWAHHQRGAVLWPVVRRLA